MSPTPDIVRGRRNSLLTVLGAGFGLAVVVGNTIGGGILRTPGDIAALLPVPALFFAAWLLGALYSFGGANAICELATMTPRSGGQYHFARRALGPYAGFLVGWTDWLATAGSATTVALVLAESLVVLFPVSWLGGGDLTVANGRPVVAVAAAVLIAFTLLLMRGVREGARTQAVTSLAKAIAFLVLIAACVVYVVGHGVASGEPPVLRRGTALLAAFVVAMQGVIYTFDGWTGAIYFTEEMKDPGRDIPRATFSGLGAVTLIYLAVLVAFVLVVPLPGLAGQPLAAGTVAGTIFGARGDLVVRLVIVFALPSTVSALLQMANRVLHAMSVDSLAPAVMRSVSDGGTPRNALMASSTVALGFLLTGTVSAVIAILSFFFVAGYAVSFLSVFVLRRREPQAPRPWRAWGHPWTTGLMLVGSLAFLGGAVRSDPRNSLVALALVVVSWPVYKASFRRDRRALRGA